MCTLMTDNLKKVDKMEENYSAQMQHNLLRKCIAEETKENTAKKAKYFKHVQDLQSCKFYMKQSQREQKVKIISI